MTLVLPVLVLLVAVGLVVGVGGEISPAAWIEGLLLTALLITGCVGFALYAAAHHW
jgi:hypothetical protein